MRTIEHVNLTLESEALEERRIVLGLDRNLTPANLIEGEKGKM
jgi:hypothetical protein